MTTIVEPSESVEQSVERLIDLFCGAVIENGPFSELTRQKARDIHHADHQRRLARDGKHNLTGETPAEYEARMVSFLGTHPVTRETLDQYRARVAPAAQTSDFQQSQAYQQRDPRNYPPLDQNTGKSYDARYQAGDTHTNETAVEYEASINNHNGVHPVTGETLSQWRSRSAAIDPQSGGYPNPNTRSS